MTTTERTHAMKPTAAEIQAALIRHLSTRQLLLVPNAYILGSPWESDLIAVTPKCYWSEFEIKLSVEDYRNDFCKRISKNYPDSPKKHVVYAEPKPIGERFGRVIPKPKCFYFVTPKGLLANVDVPEHCGLLEYDPTQPGYLKIAETRKAPRLKSPTQLSHEVMFNLAIKVSSRLIQQPA